MFERTHFIVLKETLACSKGDSGTDMKNMENLRASDKHMKDSDAKPSLKVHLPKYAKNLVVFIIISK